MKTAYPSKVLVAWGEAISGNKKIRDWLTENGFKELGIFTYAVRNKDDARKWLLENGFPHLAATVEGAEGRETAIKWLENYNFDVLAKTAMAGDGDEASFNWLVRNGHKEMAIVSQKIKEVKDEIERDNNDIHKISKD
ncbi:MAG: hypothetical protein ABR572_03710 [Cryomorphaceae bacterium]